MSTVLSNIIIPNELTAKTSELYFHGNGYTVVDGVLTVHSGGKCCFDTYFNSFSYTTYLKQTNIKQVSYHLTLSGAGCVEFFCQTKEKTVSLGKEDVNQERIFKFTFEIESLEENGIVWFSLTPRIDNNLCLLAGNLQTKTEPQQEIHLGIVICTYHREKYVEKNVRLMEREFFGNLENPYRNNVSVLIVDNGKSIEMSLSKQFTLYPNKNYGGSGGFARGMIEAYKSDRDFTHVLLMDDDIVFETESIFRVLGFLSFEKESTTPCMFGGHMLIEERPTIQFEAGGRYEKGKLKALHQNIDVSMVECLLENQIQEPSPQYQAWWFCCISMKTIEKVGFPMPFFIKTDDIEYGLRFGSPIVLMNGVGVWHSSFESKQSPHLEYYIKRNELIVSALYQNGDGIVNSLSKLVRATAKAVLMGDPRNLQFCFMAYRDFLKGTSFFLETDAELFHQDLMKQNGVTSEKSRLWALVRFPFYLLSVTVSLLCSYGKVSQELRERCGELTTGEAWEKHLGN